MEGIGEGIVQATTTVDFTTWPDKQNATDFGDAEVEVLVQHLTPVLQEAAVDPTKFADEWKHLRLQHMVSLAGCSTSRQSPGQNQTGSMQVNTPMCSS